MNRAVAVAESLQARRVGSGRWMARCPRTRPIKASLSVREGREGRLLMHCFAGCTLPAVLEACGLRMNDLFSESSLSTEHVGEAIRRREQLEAEARAGRLQRSKLTNRFHKLDRLTERLAAKMATTTASTPEVNELAKRFHQAVERTRTLGIELWGDEFR